MNKKDKIENVVIVCDFGYVDGGAARIAIETAISLQKTGINTAFFCAVGPVSEELEKSGVNVVCLNQSDILHEKSRVKAVARGIYNSVAAKRFRSLLNGYSPDNTVVHIHTWTKGISSSVFSVAARLGFRVFLTVHDYFLVCPNGGLLDYQQKKICERKPLSPSCLFCNCDSRSYPQKVFRIIRQVVQNINIRPRKNISYIFISDFSKNQFLRRYNRIPIEKQYFLTNMIHFSEERYRVKCEENKAFIFIATVSELKGIRQFCEAVTRVGVPAIVVGDGDLREEMEFKYPNIDFVGWKTKEEMLPYIEKSRCLIFPSIWYEGSPLTTLEVMSYGLPVICSDLNAGSEHILDERTGYLYNGNDIQSLIEKINTCSDDKIIAEMSQRVYENFDVEKYSARRYLSELLNIYNADRHK